MRRLIKIIAVAAAAALLIWGVVCNIVSSGAYRYYDGRIAVI